LKCERFNQLQNLQFNPVIDCDLANNNNTHTLTKTHSHTCYKEWTISILEYI